MDVTVGFDRPRLHHRREGINPICVGMLAHLCTPGLLRGAFPNALLAPVITTNFVGDVDISILFFLLT